MAAAVQLARTSPTPAASSDQAERTAPEPVRVIVFNDHPVFRSSLAWKMDSSFGVQVIADVASLYETLSLAADAERDAPDAVVADMRIGDGNSEGIESVTTLARRLGDTPIIVNSDYCSRAYLAKLIEAGATAVVPKSTGIEGLVDAIKQAVHEARSNARANEHSAA